MTLNTTLLAAGLALSLATPAAAQWAPAAGPLTTRWTADLDPAAPLPEYPRPQMTRERWQSLNGLWDYAVRPRHEPAPQRYDGRILVPFAIESALSGVMQRVGGDERLWYRRTFETPAGWAGQRVLLHFEASDWLTTVWVNGRRIGEHRGGYTPFGFDITAALEDAGPQELVVAVWDPTDHGTQPRGKQVHQPGGIWYTPTTGIWQTVWLEPVPDARIDRLTTTPDIDRGTLTVTAEGVGTHADHRVEAVARSEGTVIASGRAGVGEPIALKLDDPRLWSPASPHLYDLEVRLVEGDTPADRVGSYFGMRKIAVGPDDAGVTRILLNDAFVFQYGLLDQGFWPDGLYTAPTDEALRFDIEATRDLGFNMIRKHVKVEPRRWYYWADRLGVLVWQDMPSGDRMIGRDPDRPEIQRTAQSARQFEHELGQMIRTLGNHPSIIVWVPFNEGWGQYDTRRIADWVKRLDPTRLVNSASGWNDVGAGDMHDFHAYPGPGSPNPEPDRAAVLGEFGGLGLPLPGHTWQDRDNWGYRRFETREALTEAYLAQMRRLRTLIGFPGLSAAVYTQTTDTESETNGLLTYDREVFKIDPDTLRRAHRALLADPPAARVLMPAATHQPLAWRYTTAEPPAGWADPGFDDAGWDTGEAGFGQGAPAAINRTAWTTPDIWLRRRFTLTGDPPQNPHLYIHHDDQAEVYLNGRRVATLDGWTSAYTLIPLDDPGALQPGENTLAVHCHQDGGGQYIDLGLIDIHPGPAAAD